MKVVSDLSFYKVVLCLSLLFPFVNFNAICQVESDVEFVEIPLPVVSDSYSAFVGPTLDVVSLKGQYFVCPGITMGLIIKHRVIIGGYANFVLNHAHVQTVESVLYNVKYEYGGALVGYIFHPIKNLQFGISAKGGKADILIEKDIQTKYKNKDVLMLTPQAELYYTVNRWFKINLSAGFRMTTDLKLEPIDKYYFNGPNTSIGFVFGQFN